MPNGIPCGDTFGRVFARINPEQMQGCFQSWVSAVRELMNREIVAIDGKTLCHSYDLEAGSSAIVMLSAWASETRLVLGQRKVATKSNEITAIPELLNSTAKRGIAARRKKAAWDQDYLIKILSL